MIIMIDGDTCFPRNDRFKGCSEKITKGSVRIGKISPNPFDEGKEMTKWFHMECVFEQMKNPRFVSCLNTIRYDVT